jgi:hypothetical protein
MTPVPGIATTTLPMWRGRRGVASALICCVLALPCAFAVWTLAERSTIVPACTAYANRNGMTYSDFKLVGVKHASSVVCLLEGVGGKKGEQYLKELVPYARNLAVELAMTIEITVPAFVILLAVLGTGLSRAGARTSRPDVP